MTDFSAGVELVVAAYKTELGNTEDRAARLLRSIGAFDAWLAAGNLQTVPREVIDPLVAVRDAGHAFLNAHAVDMRERRLALFRAVSLATGTWTEATKAVRASHTVKVSDPVAVPAPLAGPRFGAPAAAEARQVRDPSDGSTAVIESPSRPAAGTSVSSEGNNGQG